MKLNIIQLILVFSRKYLINKYNKICDNNELKLEIKSGKKWIIEFPHKIIYNYIKKQVNSICEKINNILRYDEEIKSVILVGGYCSNEILISEIKKQLSNKIANFIQPSKPCLSIMEGAVSFGLNPNKIIQRKAKYTIGMAIIELWNEELHSKNGEKFYDEEFKVWRCEDCFSIFIKAKENLKLGQDIIKDYEFFQPSYCTMRFFKTLKSNPIFVNEEGVENIGQLILDAGKEYPPAERKFTVTMRIGGTFIDVKAKHLKSGKSIKTKLDFK